MVTGLAAFAAAAAGPAAAGPAPGTEIVLHTFQGGPDGYWPNQGLVHVGTQLFGTTPLGGAGNCGGYYCGTIFAVTPTGGFAQIHAFQGGSDGGSPGGRLIAAAGVIYGTTDTDAGAHPYGTVFKLNVATGVEAPLYQFTGGLDGANPDAGVTGLSGKLYGAAQSGGQFGFGSVFVVTKKGAGQVVYSFKGAPNDGSRPYSELTDVNGTLYGTTMGGGANGGGTVYSVSPSGVEKVVHSFGAGTDGFMPSGGLINVNGYLYGLTTGGGNYQKGTLYVITPDLSEHVVHSFTGETDGKSPSGALTTVNGTLYGTAAYGGSRRYGTVFQMSATGGFGPLYAFGGTTDGGVPNGNLLAVGGWLYGTTFGGGDGVGTNGHGTVFKVKM